MAIRIAVILAFALLATTCSAKASGPPEIAVDQTDCSHCRMLVSELVYAAAYQTQGQEPRLFDDIGCMIEALRSEAAFPSNVWVQDAAGGGWLDANAATFVASPDIRTPMSGGTLAYADAATAQNVATSRRADIVRSFRELLAMKGAAK